MADAHRDPHVLISARIGASQKILSLPSHRARWGWVVMLGQAKLQRPPGRFESLRQLRFLAGEFRDLVDAWLAAALLHAGPVARECSKCVAAFEEITDDEIVVHDWRAHQERVSRTTEWRRSKVADAVSVKPTRNNDERFSPRTGAPADAAVAVAVNESPSSERRTTEGGAGETDGLPVVLRWLASRRVAIAEASRTHVDLAILVDQHGAPAVIEVMGGLPQPLHDGPQYVYGARKRLNRIPDPDKAQKGLSGSREEAERAFKSA